MEYVENPGLKLILLVKMFIDCFDPAIFQFTIILCMKQLGKNACKWLQKTHTYFSTERNLVPISNGNTNLNSSKHKECQRNVTWKHQT